MAHLNKETIQTLTELSRIGCDEAEKEALLKDLEQILSYVDLLEEIDTSGVRPCNSVHQREENVWRADVVKETLPREKFLENAPEQVGGLVRVPTVIQNRGNS